MNVQIAEQHLQSGLGEGWGSLPHEGDPAQAPGRQAGVGLAANQESAWDANTREEAAGSQVEALQDLQQAVTVLEMECSRWREAAQVGIHDVACY